MALPSKQQPGYGAGAEVFPLKSAGWAAGTEVVVDTDLSPLGAIKIVGLKYSCQNDSGAATAWGFRMAFDASGTEFDVMSDGDINFADSPTGGMATLANECKYMTAEFPNGIVLPGKTVSFGVTPGGAVDGGNVTAQVELIFEQVGT